MIQNSVSHAVADRWMYDRGEFHYVDFSGPFETSRQGNIYMCLFVDRRTRLIVGFFAKRKTEETAMGIIKRFREENLSAPIHPSKHFIFLQSDNGEFSSRQVRAYSWRSRIFQRFSSPHHSLMNGPVERAIKKVKTIGKCMLEDRHMPQMFWEDAAKMAIYVLNRTPNRYEGRWQREAMYLMFGILTD